jgi:hypothetical protein
MFHLISWHLEIYVKVRMAKYLGALFGWQQRGAFGEHRTTSFLEENSLMLLL